MADVNKTVDISVKADMKQLLNEFKKMPGMTAKEAKKMVSMLEREFKNAEKAAKKAADQQAKAMQKIGNAAKNSSREIRGMKRSSTELGGALMATGDIIGEVDPALGGFVATLSIAGTAVRDLGKALLTGNPYILGAVVAAGAAAAAYSYFNSETESLDKSQSNLVIATQNAQSAIAAQETAAFNAATALSSARASVEDLKLEYELLSGQVSEFDADMKKAEKRTEAFKNKIVEGGTEQEAANRAAIEAQKTRIKQLNTNLKLMEETNRKTKEGGGLTDDYAHKSMNLAKAQEELGRLQTKQAEDREKFAEQAANEIEDYRELQEAIARTKEEDRKRREQEKRNRAFAARQAKKEAEEQRKLAKSQSDLAKEEQRLFTVSQQILNSSNKARQDADTILLDNQKMKISLMDSELEKINAQAELENSQLEKKIGLLQKEKDQNTALAETEEQRILATLANKDLDAEIEALKEQSFIKDMEFSNQRIEALEKEKQKRFELIDAIVAQSAQGAEAVSQIIKNVSGENRTAAMIAFRINQASAISNIAMTTAQKIMEVAPNPFAIAGISALGALQAGVVATQPPPEFHMGGVIDKGEDTRNITVLTGEAVLDRRTVENIGGDAGVSRLQRGELPKSEVIVMNPFKHFDRYAMASSKRGGVMGKFSNNKASGSY